MARLDYDTIAHLYDERLRDHTVDAHLLDLLPARAETSPARILDIGCGTGKQVAANRAHLPGVILVGVDRSVEMLRVARARCPRAYWVHADGAALPLKSGAFDYITSQYSYQHIGRTEQFLREVFRVLKRGGRFVLTNIDPWSMPGWLVYQYFPDAVKLDHRDFLPVDALVTTMEAIGFCVVRAQRTDQSKTERLRDFLEYASGRHRASQLTAISDEAYAAGIDRLQRAVAAAPDDVVTNQFVRVTLIGDHA